MLLGDIIRDLADESTAAEALLSLGDLPLVARIQHARRSEATAGAYAAGAVARFADCADDKAWLGLMNRIERTDDPAAACLRTMVEWSLTLDEGHACGCGDGGCGNDHG